jgi:hypothetical protein
MKAGWNLTKIGLSNKLLNIESNRIGQNEIRQLSQCHWNNLSHLYLSNPKIIEVTIRSETQAASGLVNLCGSISIT